MIAHPSTTFGGPAAVAVGTNGQCRERRRGGERPFGSSSRSCSCAPHQPRRSSTHPDHPSLVVTSSTSSSASDADPRRRTTVRARPPVHVSDSTSVLPGAHCSSISLLLDFFKRHCTRISRLVSSRVERGTARAKHHANACRVPSEGRERELHFYKFNLLSTAGSKFDDSNLVSCTIP
jgi:hypothetical protein